MRSSWTILVPQLTANHSLPAVQVLGILRQISNRPRILPVGDRGTLAWEYFHWKQIPVKTYNFRKGIWLCIQDTGIPE